LGAQLFFDYPDPLFIDTRYENSQNSARGFEKKTPPKKIFSKLIFEEEKILKNCLKKNFISNF